MTIIVWCYNADIPINPRYLYMIRHRLRISFGVVLSSTTATYYFYSSLPGSQWTVLSITFTSTVILLHISRHIRSVGSNYFVIFNRDIIGVIALYVNSNGGLYFTGKSSTDGKVTRKWVKTWRLRNKLVEKPNKAKHCTN